MNDPSSTEKYYPPSRDELVHFAQAVGEEMGAAYADPDIVGGLADFMGVVAHALAADLNRKRAGMVDSRIE